MDRLRNGSLWLWGMVGEVALPEVVMSLIVEPTKPCLCHEERFLNLWVNDMPFKHETDVPRLPHDG